MSRDKIYSRPLTEVGDFEFDDAVADVFSDMIRRSVPGYASMLSMIGRCAEMYVPPLSAVYDLGCSLGASTLAARENCPENCIIHAIDNSAPMLERLGTQLESLPPGPEVRLSQSDIRDVQIDNASFVILNLTLQFLPPEERQPMLQTIFNGMRPGGALLLSEKICFDDEAEQQLMTTLHHDFKRAHGYSDLEIAQKRTAIENRLVPETMTAHVARLKGVGFTSVAPWFQCFTFASILAVK